MDQTPAAIRQRIQQRLAEEGAVALSAPSRFERRVRVREAVARLLAEDGVVMPAPQIAQLVHDIADAVIGLGPLEPLLRDPAITEIMVVAPSRIYVEREGRIERSLVTLASEQAIVHAIERIVAPLGLRIDESKPWVDARLPDGSRVHAIIPPLAVSGPTLTIRKFTRTAIDAEGLLQSGSWTREQMMLLQRCVRRRRNIVVSGGTGAGKTTFLNVLSSFIDPSERVVTIEDAAELRLAQPHVVALEARPPNVEGRGQVTIRDLVRNALRMRPDRIVVGEVRGGEALDMLQAMNTGHEGSMSTAHANSAQHLLSRLEAMVLMSGAALPSEAIRRQISSGIDVIVHLERLDGRRRVVQIARVVESANGLEASEMQP